MNYPYFTDLSRLVSVYNTVQSTSAFWEESADILPTVTNYLSTNNVLVNGLTVNGNVSANGVRISFGTGIATGTYSFAEGDSTIASGQASHAEGTQAVASSASSHAEGEMTLATGLASHAEGQITTASGLQSHAEGSFTATGERVPFATYTQATRLFTFTPSNSSKFSNVTAGVFLRGWDSSIQYEIFKVASRNTTTGAISAASDVFGTNSSSGYLITNSGTSSHAEGNSTTASGQASHAEGTSTFARGDSSHAEGYNTSASGNNSHAEGTLTYATGESSHAEGESTVAAGVASHAEGYATRAIGNNSHAAGTFAEAAHNRTWFWRGTNYVGFLSTTREDQFMVRADGGSAFYGNVGIGTDNNQNALTVVGIISTGIYGTSNDWNSVYNTVKSTSATWEESAEILPTVTNYLSTSNILVDGLTVVQSISTRNYGTSELWNSVYSTVRSTSGTWEESAEILPTVTNYLSTNNILVDGLTVVQSISTRDYGTSELWNLAYSSVRSASAQWSGQLGLSAVEQEKINITLNQQSKFLTVNNTTTGTVIIPADNTVNFPNGSQVNITRLGTGVVYVSASPGVYLRSADNKKELRVQYSTATVVKLSANDWLLFGDIV